MKGLFLFVAACVLFVGDVSAQENCGTPRREVTFRCLSPCDIVLGVGCYTVDVGRRVVKGTGQIISAPFKAKCCIPKAQMWRWRPGHWTPGKLYRIPGPPTEENIKKKIKYFPPLHHTPPNADNLVWYAAKF